MTDKASVISFPNRGDHVARGQNNRQTTERRKKTIRPKTPKQVEYWNAIPENDVTFAIGPAGSGKTLLAVARAVEALERGEVEKIILTRPAVEAGERLGYLPGTLSEKIDPYLRPLTESIKSIVGVDQYTDWLAMEQVVASPLAFLRGMTVNDSFFIFDESQNSTVEQMRMVLTRFGYGSKFVITGDPDQSDLEDYENGLDYAIEVTSRMRDMNGIGVVWLGEGDIVRHPVVGRFVDGFAKLSNLRKESA